MACGLPLMWRVGYRWYGVRVTADVARGLPL